MSFWDTVKKTARIGAAVGTLGASEVAIAGFNKLTETPDMPAAPVLDPAPNPNDEATAAKLRAAQEAQRRARGRASTILTGQGGTSGLAPTASQTLTGSS